MRKRYSVIRADNLMCGPACINMVFVRRGLPEIDQGDLAMELGLVVPESKRVFYPRARVSNDKQAWGIHPQEKKFALDRVLKKLNVPIAYKYVPWREVPSGSHCDFIEEHLNAGNDVLIGFDYAETYGDGDHVGHVCVVELVDAIRGEIAVIDPSSPDPRIPAIAIVNMLKGVSKKNDGYWIFGTDRSLESVGPVL